ncbi:MAG: Glycosyl transferase family protein [Microgenomates group bacterium Gr01-1014_5]|nr:MAG: Glycosyl transferase family protein [Microgenomates group bacterium Gr01-1014_5]
MNILVFSWRDPKHPLAGGAEQVMHEHMKGWVAAGHEVTLFSSRFKNSQSEEEIDGVRIIRRGHQYHLGVQFAGFFFYLSNRNKFDLIVDQFHGMPFFTPLYSAKPKIAVIQEVAREVWFLNPLPRPLNWIYGIVGHLLEPLVLSLYKGVPFITGSESAKRDVISFGIPGKNITVVPHGVIVSRPIPFPQKEKTKTVVFLGVISRDKGIVDAIECFNLLSKTGSYRFWVIGRPESEEYYRYVKERVIKNRLGDKVKFWGYVSQSKKFELLARAHVLINPSVREGWGLVNIEANAMGTPVIAYKSPGLVDSVKEGNSGLICSENSPENIADNVKKLFGDNLLYAKLQEGAKRWAGMFSWEKSKKQSLKLLKNIANE